MLPEIDGFAIPQMYLEFDALVECEANDPLAGPPESWPPTPEIDDDRYELGPALTPDEVIPDDLVEPDPDVFPLTDAATIAELRRVECTAWSRWLATRAEPQP